ncbi:hypothetical protein Prudu_010184, partial [Prunus dulcis]
MAYSIVPPYCTFTETNMLSLRIEHYANEILAYTKKVLKHFYEDYPLGTLGIFRKYIGPDIISRGDIHQGEHPEVCCTDYCNLLPSISFLPHWFFSKQVFNDATDISFVVSKGECCKGFCVKPTNYSFGTLGK